MEQHLVVTPGRVVTYRLSEADAEAINRRREHARAHIEEHRENSNGVQIHSGNPVQMDREFPMIVVALMPPSRTVNGQVFLDGNDTLWVQMVPNGNGPGCWRWPDRV